MYAYFIHGRKPKHTNLKIELTSPFSPKLQRRSYAIPFDPCTHLTPPKPRKQIHPHLAQESAHEARLPHERRHRLDRLAYNSQVYESRFERM